MTPLTSFAGRTVALFGLGASGLDAARALLLGGARVIAWDDQPGSREKAAAVQIEVADLATADWSHFASLILAPGVPLTHPEPHWVVRKAQAAGVEIIGDIELFCRERAKIAPGSPFVAITGTNGKSTTTALTAHLFKSFGREVAMGGNIGTPVLQLPPPSPECVHVVECSSFQIDLAPSLNPSVGVLMNLTPDHLDRHGTMANYAAVKARLVAGAETAVISVDDPDSRAIAARLVADGHRVETISVEGQPVTTGIIRDGSRLCRVREGAISPLVELDGIASLRGAHNAQNAAAAILALGSLAEDREKLQAALRAFPGLAHRMEQVGRLGAVVFVNYSKATNADAAEKALLSFAKVHWIIGGVAKEGGITPLRPLFPRVAKAYLIGAASDAFAATLGAEVPHEFCATLDVATKRAAADAAQAASLSGQDEIVLLSPACASFDQFPNFEKRGDFFRQTVKALIGASALFDQVDSSGR
jgi:UDP-N-acetylmuramoylalanine--D-glutamate ligase